MTLKVIFSLQGSEGAPGLQHSITTNGILTFFHLCYHARIFYACHFPTHQWDMRLRLKTGHVGADGLPPLLQENTWHREAWDVYTRNGEMHVVVSFTPKPGTGLMRMLEAVRRMEVELPPRGLHTGGGGMAEVQDQQPRNHAGENEHARSTISRAASGGESENGQMSPTLMRESAQVQNRTRRGTLAPSIAEAASDVSPTPRPTPETSTPSQANHSTQTPTPTPSAPLLPYPPLPPHLTPQTFRATLVANLTADVPPTHKFHIPGRNWTTFTVWRRNGVAKALMIEGEYGVAAQRPCVSCVQRGRECRVWHPLIRGGAEWANENCVKEGRKGGRGVGRGCSWCLAKPGVGAGGCAGE